MTGSMWPSSVRIDCPVVASQTRTVLSWLAEASFLPSGLYATA